MAKALRFHAVVRGKALPLPDLSAFEGKRVEVIVLAEEDAAEALEQTAETPAAPALRGKLGMMRDVLQVPDDFDAPLPPEIQRYFDGEGDGDTGDS
jgi:hypothetical protein